MATAVVNTFERVSEDNSAQSKQNANTRGISGDMIQVNDDGITSNSPQVDTSSGNNDGPQAPAKVTLNSGDGNNNDSNIVLP